MSEGQTTGRSSSSSSRVRRARARGAAEEVKKALGGSSASQGGSQGLTLARKWVRAQKLALGPHLRTPKEQFTTHQPHWPHSDPPFPAVPRVASKQSNAAHAGVREFARWKRYACSSSPADARPRSVVITSQSRLQWRALSSGHDVHERDKHKRGRSSALR